MPDLTEYYGLLEDVASRPDDDFPRLVLADWLEDHETQSPWTRRAEYVREAVALKGRDDLSESASCYWGLRRLLSLYGTAWLERDCPDLLREVWRDPDDYDRLFQCDWDRGFVWRVSCSLADWRECGKTIVKRTPVICVASTGDKSPATVAELFGWYREDHVTESHSSRLPADVFALLDGYVVSTYFDGRLYESAGDATAAYFRACLAWARLD